ncbi:MAG: hypothetical protein OJF47_002402 [Nitrospira sp.]|jgi:hypothetical protein|nr:MAG: hypothetical protein OJF47_002402 [Nitrospira sp.]
MDGLKQSHITVLINHRFDRSDHRFSLPLKAYIKLAMHG